MNPKLHTLRVRPAIRRQRSTLRALMDRFIAREAAQRPAGFLEDPIIPFPQDTGKVVPFYLAPRAS